MHILYLCTHRFKSLHKARTHSALCIHTNNQTDTVNVLMDYLCTLRYTRIYSTAHELYMHTHIYKHHQYAIIVSQLLSLRCGAYWLWPEGPIKQHQLIPPKGNLSLSFTHTHTTQIASIITFLLKCTQKDSWIYLWLTSAISHYINYNQVDLLRSHCLLR